jgi:hypothetical protein
VRTAGYHGWTEVEIMNADVWAAPWPQTLTTVAERYLRYVAEPGGPGGVDQPGYPGISSATGA